MTQQTILTVPPGMADYLSSPAGADYLDRLRVPAGATAFATADPPGCKLGSGGGTVHALWQAWIASGAADLHDWLRSGKRVVLHAGGQSRRLPAYAAVGKAFLPLPAIAALPAPRFDQMLCDFQLPLYSRTLEEAGPKAVVLVASGDVWLEFDPLRVPVVAADLTGLGMRVAPEVARHFGVFFLQRVGRGLQREIASFLQKPSVDDINQRSRTHDFLVDSGMWILSAEAVEFLFRQCGWTAGNTFANGGLPAALDLYSEIGVRLGTGGLEGLTSAVVPLSDAAFHHLGSNRQLFESLYAMDKAQGGARKDFLVATPAGCCTNDSRRPLWADGVTAHISVSGANMATGLPEGCSVTHLPEYICLDIAPVGENGFCFRPYHLDDTGRGDVSGGATICGRDAREWLQARGIDTSGGDVFDAAVYPVLPHGGLDQRWLDWFLADAPAAETTAAFHASERLSAAAIPERINLDRYFAARRDGHAGSLRQAFRDCVEHGDSGLFDQDFSALAAFIPDHAADLARWIVGNRDALDRSLPAIEHRIRLSHFLEKLGTNTGAGAFDQLRDAILERAGESTCKPRLNLKADQIVWARSPVRIDLAGGWTDTPPFCFERGGCVLNMAVNLNGQPPVQVFLRPTPDRIITIKSIDLGAAQELRSFEDVAAYRDPSGSFSLARAALALAGFHPDFAGAGSSPSLAAQLDELGSGLELTLLCAVPKGSGLGTSSILAATLLGALNKACDLGWDAYEIYRRVLRLEQLLTTGGGWQDQAGALFPGIKLIETAPGFEQVPVVRYLPADLTFSRTANRTILLYYTGLTRLAKNILGEIVSDMILGRRETRQTLEFIRANARNAYEAVQRDDEGEIAASIARSWQFNKQLDSGTTSPEIEAILAACGSNLRAMKLPGAGGGGYMLMWARDESAAGKIRQTLGDNPPNERARFVDFEISRTGLEVTVS